MLVIVSIHIFCWNKWEKLTCYNSRYFPFVACTRHLYTLAERFQTLQRKYYPYWQFRPSRAIQKHHSTCFQSPRYLHSPDTCWVFSPFYNGPCTFCDPKKLEIKTFKIFWFVQLKITVKSPNKGLLKLLKSESNKELSGENLTIFRLI